MCGRHSWGLRSARFRCRQQTGPAREQGRARAGKGCARKELTPRGVSAYQCGFHKLSHWFQKFVQFAAKTENSQLGIFDPRPLEVKPVELRCPGSRRREPVS
jgi:hypothetical protein